jgi:hypothetical protein
MSVIGGQDHSLRSEGAPHDDRGVIIGYNGISGVGRAYCRCGVLSPVLPSARQRRIWHRAHKARVQAGESEPDGD